MLVMATPRPGADEVAPGEGVPPEAVPMKPRAILWDLFGDHLRYIDGGRVPMRALTQLLDVFGVGESTSRVVLSRMRREGWFTTCRDGRQTSYALTGRSIRMLDEGRARIFDRGRDDWDGTWRMVIYAVPEESRGERDRVRRGWRRG
jgi:phenylacetic acid degradation operon negative regulatory protein